MWQGLVVRSTAMGEKERNRRIGDICKRAGTAVDIKLRTLRAPWTRGWRGSSHW